MAAPVFNPAKGAAAPLLPEELPRLEDGVAQFYGAVGNVLCSTLWDPGSSINLVTPEFARVLQGKGVPWEYCKPMQIDHGSGEEGGVKSAAPAVRRIRTDVLLCEKGLTFRLENVVFYVYRGALPDVILSRKLLEKMVCLEQPGTKLLNWSVSQDDVSRLARLVDSAQVQAHCAMRACNNSTHPSEPNVQRALQEMVAQRERLRTRVDKAVSAEAEAACAAVCDEFPENWRPPGKDPCKLGIFKIQLKDHTKSYVCLPRRTSPLVMAEMRRQVQEQAAAGVIERCEGTPSSVYAIHMARHPVKQTLRFCLDARPLNANTVLMPYAMPEIGESLDRLAGYKYYCAFDLSAYFQQFELAEECRDMMAFLIPGDESNPPEIWRYKRLTFGVVNASFWAQRQLAEALAKFPGCESLRNFIDDICFGANSVSELCAKTRALMQFCKHYNLRLKREKAKLAVGAVRHLGFIISEEGKSLDPARVDSLVNILPPKNFKALKSLLGSFAFVRGWLADASTTSAPLTDLLSESAKKRGFCWGQEQDDALAKLKLLVSTAPTLAKPDYNRPFRIYVDASDVGVGAVLVQMLPNPLTGKEELAAVAYKSRRFSDRERRWPVGERECFACRYGLESFKEYILQHPDVTLYCDHHNMINMWSCASAKITRWRLFMQQFEPFKIVHVEGRANVCADALSRLHLYNLMLPKQDNLSDEEARLAEEGEGGNDEALMNMTWGELVDSVNARHHEHAVCCNLQFARCNLKRGGEEYLDRDGADGIAPVLAPRDPDEKILLSWLRNAEPLGDVVQQGVRDAVQDVERAGSPLVPAEATTGVASAPSAATAESQTCEAELRESRKRSAGRFPNRRIIDQAHGESHPGVATTWARVQRLCAVAPGERGAVARDEVRRFCEACPVCQKLKPARERLERAAGNIRQRPFTQYAFDVIVLPSPDLRGHRYILTVVDSFSGAAELFALKHSSAEEVCEHLVDVMCRWTRPHSVRCDNAKSFAAALMQKLLDAAKVEQHFVAPFSHQANGQVENLNRRVEHVLRTMILDAKLGAPNQNNWSVLLPMVRGIINSKLVHRHGCTANELLFGATSQRQSIFEDEPWMEGVVPSVAVSGELEGAAAQRAGITVQRWRDQHEQLLASCEAAQDALLQQAANLRGPEAAEIDSLVPGDTVLVSAEERSTHKLAARWLGPYLVVNAPEGQRVTLQHLSSKRVGDFELAMCKRFDLGLVSEVDELLPLAAADHFEYVVAEVEQHRPSRRKLPNGRLRPKGDFEFLVRWEGLPLGEDNPSWEPWSNGSLRSCEAYVQYLQRPEVVGVLGASFGEATKESGGERRATLEGLDTVPVGTKRRR